MMTVSQKIYPKLAFFVFFLAGMSLFLFQNHVNGFDAGHHGFLSSHGIALAKNLMRRDQLFLMYEYEAVQDGKAVYQPYNRFPLFPFGVIGLLIQPFEPQLAWQIYAARQLMNLFLVLTMLLISKLVAALVGDWRLAVIVTLLAASTIYILRYNDMIFNDMPGLCGFVLALYAVVKAQKGPFTGPQLALFALLPITMSWQPYAVFITWVAVDFVTLVLLAPAPALAQRIALFLRSASFRVTFWAVVWGSCILGLQLLNEWRVIGGALQSLPSVKSLIYRIGTADPTLDTQFHALLRWDRLSLQQASRILLTLVPFGGIDNLLPSIGRALLINRVVGLAVLTTGLFAYIKVRPLPIKVGLILLGSGLVWAFGMRHFVVFHDFQTVYYIGFAIAGFLSIATLIPAHSRTSALLAVCALFIISIYQSNATKTKNAPPLNAVTAEFQNIYNHLPAGSKVYLDGDRYALGIGYHAVDFYLAGSITAPQSEAAYAISENPNFAGMQVTANPTINLFEVNHTR